MCKQTSGHTYFRLSVVSAESNNPKYVYSLRRLGLCVNLVYFLYGRLNPEGTAQSGTTSQLACKTGIIFCVFRGERGEEHEKIAQIAHFPVALSLYIKDKPAARPFI